MANKLDFCDWFEKVTGKKPYPYQERLVVGELPIVIDVPTGLGKTAAIVLAWLWRRKYSEDQDLCAKTPRRLIYVLPMRTLVVQTLGEIDKWLKAAGESELGIQAYQLMGGAVSDGWDRDPTKDCIIVGTQDQILSRCLNRGYSMNKFRWPIHFGLLNQDCLFVIDETQLMGAGLRTTAQLQGLRELWQTFGPSQTVWMSATLDAALLKTADHAPDLERTGAYLRLEDEDRKHDRVKLLLNSQKPLQRFPIACPKAKDEAKYIDQLAVQIVAEAQRVKTETETGKDLVLVICNRVRRAQALYDKLRSKVPTLLIHSRFRSGDRKTLNDQLNSASGVVIATQAIEAGVDISAQCLFTELSPWSSFVQRVGRCNRRGTDNATAKVYWIDFEDLDDDSVRPYEKAELEKSRKLLDQLTDVGPKDLQAFWAELPEEERPKQPIEGMIPRQHDLMQLFDTSVDLAGHDIDISCFIRDAKNTDVAIAWREWDGDVPSDNFALERDELCQVSIGEAKKFLEKKAKGYTFDRLQKIWVPVNSKEIYPGMTILVNCRSGGYNKDIGFTGEPKHVPNPVELKLSQKMEPDDGDPQSQNAKEFVSLLQHSEDIVEALNGFLETIKGDLDDDFPIASLLRAARGHDVGKVHSEFQNMLKYGADQDRQSGVWAKSDRTYEQQKAVPYSYPAGRRGFRHELVSALMLLDEPDFLVPYLAACHHGKVRLTIQPRPTDQPFVERTRETAESTPDKPELKPEVTGSKWFALGVHEGDKVDAIDLGDGMTFEKMTLSLACMELGGERRIEKIGEGRVKLVGTESWTARSVKLLERYGPFRLAYLETLIRLADWQASAKAEVITEGDE
jgi:CRISPR-associated endonuclease/helicase Cas3